MLPRNIDLTENRDFNDHEVFTIANVHRLRNRLRNIDAMSLNEYNMLEWWDSIFGEKGHPNRTEHIFSPIKRWERRIPWEPNNYSVYELNNVLNNMLYDDDAKYKLFPWYEAPRAINGRNAKEIFHLR